MTSKVNLVTFHRRCTSLTHGWALLDKGGGGYDYIKEVVNLKGLPKSHSLGSAVRQSRMGSYPGTNETSLCLNVPTYRMGILSWSR